jgi:hypothetical protein
MRLLLCIAALLAEIAGGCALDKGPPKSQLQIRQFQTRDFDTTDAKLVMKAMLNVLQDDGYVVKNAVIDLGLITAMKEIDLAPGRSGSGGGGLFDILGGGTVILGGTGNVVVGTQGEARYRKTEVLDFTGNVSEFGAQTKVRISFQRKVLDNRGEVVEVKPIDDQDFYQEFFSRMDKSVFLQREDL